MLFLGLVFGLGLPLVVGAKVSTEEKICIAPAVGVILLYLAGLTRYWLDLPAVLGVALPAGVLVLCGLRWRACLKVLREPAAGYMLGSYLLVAGWLLGFLALVRSYSGGGWALDWAAHYDRARFFLERWPSDHLLLGRELLPTRPPLANVVTATFMSLTGSSCAYFQIFMTLTGSLVFLPGWLFTGRFASDQKRAWAVFTVLFMLNPAVLQNGTFAWTKLLTMFFVLTSLWFFIHGLFAGSRRSLAGAFALTSAGFITHYSAGPYAAALVGAYLWWQRHQLMRRPFWGGTGMIAVPAALLLATWFGWAVLIYGPTETFLSNTSVTESTAISWTSFLSEKSHNLYCTLIPHPFRPVDYGFIAQSNRPGFLRDYFFLLYQVNLPLMLGSMGAGLLGYFLWKRWRTKESLPNRPRIGFWAWLVGCTLVLGVSAYGGIDQWGVAHLCLIGLVLLGLAFLAASMPTASLGLKVLLTFGMGVDSLLGIGLHFYLENHPHPFSEAIADGGIRLLREFGATAWVNYQAKRLYGCEFVGDWLIAKPLLVAFLASLLLLALRQLRRKPPGPARFDGPLSFLPRTSAGKDPGRFCAGVTPPRNAQP